MQVRVGIAAEHSHRLGAGRAHRGKLRAQGTGYSAGPGWRTAVADEEPVPLPWRAGVGVAGRVRAVGRADSAAGRLCDRGVRDALAPLPERDVDRPVLTAGHAVFPRSVERVDDPDAVGSEPAGRILRLFRQHGVVRPCRRQLRQEQGIRVLVAPFAEIGAAGSRLGPQPQQQGTSRAGQPRREPGVALAAHPASPSIRLTSRLACAAASPSSGISRSCGASGAS